MKGNLKNYGSIQGYRIVEQDRTGRTIRCLIGLLLIMSILIVTMAGVLSFVLYPMIMDQMSCDNSTSGNEIPKDNIVTLYALDPIAHSFSFGDGRYGEIMKDGSIYNRASDIDFNIYQNGSFTVGIEGAEVGTIVDLGSSDDLQRKYKYQETVGNGQGFASIHRQNSTLLIARISSYDHIYQIMDESKALFESGRPGANAKVHLGHIYAVRITDHTKPTYERIAKMIVIAYEPNVSVTIRWEVLA